MDCAFGSEQAIATLGGSGLSGRLWPVHLKPLPDELLSSWVVRLAAAHGLKLRTFCSLAWPKTQLWNRDLDKSATDAILSVLVEKTGTSAERVAATCLAAYEGTLYETHNPNGNTRWILPVGVYHQTRTRFGLLYCPRCLLEDPTPYFRRVWRLACTTLCVHHKVQLRDRCPHCGAPVVFHRGDLGDRNKRIPDPVTLCHDCRDDLREGLIVAADPAELARERLIAEIIHRGWTEIPGSGWIYSHLYFDVLRHLMRILTGGRRSARVRQAACRHVGIPEFTVPGGPREDVERLSLETRRAILHTALALLDDWPDGFVRLCEKNRIWSSTLLQDLRVAPFWYWKVVHEHLYRTSPSPTDKEIVWLREHNTGIFGASRYTTPKRLRRKPAS